MLVHFGNSTAMNRCVQWVGEEWPSGYTHPELQLVLVVYVDDFKMAGQKNNLKKG